VDDRRVFEETLDENKTAIAAQVERVEMCVVIIRAQLGISGTGNAHYAVAAGQTGAPSAGTAQTDAEPVGGHTDNGSRSDAAGGQDATTSEAAREEEDGLYL
jgi:hypothetical protein